MKLSDWADKQGISYLTAYRWFKAGKLPVKAYQSDSGTIIVQDESENLEQQMVGNSNSNNSDVMSLFLKKTVEFSKNNSSIEDFAAFIISNFSLKPNVPDSPRYSKVKPKTEDIQKHFQKFMPERNTTDHLKMIKTLLKDEKPNSFAINEDTVKSMDPELFKELSFALSKSSVDNLSEPDTIVEGVVSRNVEFESTPQQINYTGSTNTTAFDSSLQSIAPATAAFSADSRTFTPVVDEQLYSFKPTQKELESAHKVLENTSPRRKRGRKPSNKSGSNQ